MPDLHRTGKAYTVSEVAKYARTSAATIRRWISGYKHQDRQMEPVFADKAAGNGAPLLSFLDLAEIVVAVKFTQNGGRLEKVRAARRRVLTAYPALEYPFASLRLRQLAGEILHHVDDEWGGKALALSLGGTEGDQYVLQPFVDQAIDLFDHDPLDTMATRWYPRRKDVPVVVDPHFGGGRLTIVGHSITAETVWQRFYEGNQEIEFIAQDYEIDPHLVEEIIRLARPPVPEPATV